MNHSELLDTVPESASPFFFHKLPIVPPPSSPGLQQQQEQQQQQQHTDSSGPTTTCLVSRHDAKGSWFSTHTSTPQTGLRRSSASQYGAVPTPHWMPASQNVIVSAASGQSGVPLTTELSRTEPFPFSSSFSEDMEDTTQPRSALPFLCQTPCSATLCALSELHPSNPFATAEAEGAQGMVSGFAAASRHTRAELAVFDGVHVTARSDPTLSLKLVSQQRSMSSAAPTLLPEVILDLPSSTLNCSASLLAWPHSSRMGSNSVEAACLMPRIPISVATSSSSNSSAVGWAVLPPPPSPHRSPSLPIPPLFSLPPAFGDSVTERSASFPDKPGAAAVLSPFACTARRAPQRQTLSLGQLERQAGGSYTNAAVDSSAVPISISGQSTWGSGISSSIDDSASVAVNTGGDIKPTSGKHSPGPSSSMPEPATQARVQRISSQCSAPSPF